MKAILLLALFVAPSSAQNTCTNHDRCTFTCAGCSDGDKIPDPYDCHNYYFCDDSGGIYPVLPLTCDDGFYFDMETHECKEGNSCTSCVKVCPYECPSATGARSHPYDCSLYYDCSNPSTVSSCPVGSPYFDGTSCQTDVTQCCSCKPYCTVANNWLIIDPVDCTKYWTCHTLGTPTAFGRCPAGQNFDESIQDCSELATCNTVPGCYNVIGSDYCIDVFTCVSAGLSPKCFTSCVSEYYNCTDADIGNRIEPHTCTHDTVFNPDNYQCISSGDCPYPSILPVDAGVKHY